jgi:hypothetical protein
MPCANTIHHSLVFLPAPTRVPLRWRAFIATIVVIQDAIDAFQEALDMRRAAHNRRYLNDE